jgi:hypothetical protein
MSIKETKCLMGPRKCLLQQQRTHCEGILGDNEQIPWIMLAIVHNPVKVPMIYLEIDRKITDRSALFRQTEVLAHARNYMETIDIAILHLSLNQWTVTPVEILQTLTHNLAQAQQTPRASTLPIRIVLCHQCHLDRRLLLMVLETIHLLQVITAEMTVTDQEGGMRRVLEVVMKGIPQGKATMKVVRVEVR